MKPIKDLFEIRTGYIMSRVLGSGEGEECISLPVISHNNISACFLDREITNVEYKNFKRSFYEKNGETGLLRENDIVLRLGYPYHSMLITKKFEGSVVSSFCAVLRVKDSNKANAIYYQKLFENEFFIGKDGKFSNCIKERSEATSVISLKKLGEVEIPVPSIEKQNALACVFTDCKKRIQVLNDMIKAEKCFMEGLLVDEPRVELSKKYADAYRKLRREYSKIFEDFNG